MPSKIERERNQENHIKKGQYPLATEEVSCPSQEVLHKAALRAFELGNMAPVNTPVHKSRKAIHLLLYSKDVVNKTDLLYFLSKDVKKDGSPSYPTTTSFGIALLSHLAFQYNDLTKYERHLIYKCYKALLGGIPKGEPESDAFRLTLASGLKSEVNETTSLQETENVTTSQFKNKEQVKKNMLEEIKVSTKCLLDGGQRTVIDRHTKYEHFIFKQFPDVYNSKSELKRQLPAFFPEDINKKTTDRIVLHGGGSKTHFAVTVIWTKPCDKEGNLLAKDSKIKPEGYRVYRTMCNAGYGTSATIVESQLYQENPEQELHSDGLKSYTITTQEVLLPKEVAYSYAAMRKEVEKLINAERELCVLQDDSPSPYQDSHPDFDEWRAINRCVRLGPVITSNDQSIKASIQGDANCTMRSTIEYLRWVLLEDVPAFIASDIIGDIWNFCAKHYSGLLEHKFKYEYPREKGSQNKLLSFPAVTESIKAGSAFNLRMSSDNVVEKPNHLREQSAEAKASVEPTSNTATSHEQIPDNDSNSQSITPSSQNPYVAQNIEEARSEPDLSGLPAENQDNTDNNEITHAPIVDDYKSTQTHQETTTVEPFNGHIEEEENPYPLDLFPTAESELDRKNTDNGNNKSAIAKEINQTTPESTNSNSNLKKPTTEGDQVVEAKASVEPTPNTATSHEQIPDNDSNSQSITPSSQNPYVAQNIEKARSEPNLSGLPAENQGNTDKKEINQTTRDSTNSNSNLKKPTTNLKAQLIQELTKSINGVSGKTFTLAYSKKDKQNALLKHLENYEKGDSDALKQFIVEAATARDTFSLLFCFKFYKHASFAETATSKSIIATLEKRLDLVKFLFEALGSELPTKFDGNEFKKLANTLLDKKSSIGGPS